MMSHPGMWQPCDVCQPARMYQASPVMYAQPDVCRPALRCEPAPCIRPALHLRPRCMQASPYVHSPMYAASPMQASPDEQASLHCQASPRVCRLRCGSPMCRPARDVCSSPDMHQPALTQPAVDPGQPCDVCSQPMQASLRCMQASPVVYAGQPCMIPRPALHVTQASPA
ncbi:MAG: hypothetical protein H6581_02670 [Bacteroidia bacterium]|nr:hypothetical protein [Bacteroidia bacterium]